MLKIAERAIRLRIIAQGRAARRDRFGQDIANGGGKQIGFGMRLSAFEGEFSCRPFRRKPGAMQCFAHIDVAQSGDQALVQERGFQRRLLARKQRSEPFTIQFIAERLDSEPFDVAALGQGCARHEIHETEAPRVVIDDPRSALDMKHDMVMRRDPARLMNEFALEGALSAVHDGETARHAKMHDQRLAGGEVGDQIFGPPPQRGEGLPFEPLDEPFGKRKAQIRPPLFHPDQAAAFHDGREAAPDGFDFGQLGHGVFRKISPSGIASSRVRRYGPRAIVKGQSMVQTSPGRDDDTHFGFSTVRLGEKQGMVDDVFHKVARRYDLMNDLMSAGLHRAWKDALVSALRPPKQGPFDLLDVAGGTGDVSFRVLDAASPQARATVCDINGDMLAVGRERAPAKLADRLTFVEGNAEDLPFPDKSFDAYTIAFGIRNVPRIDKALSEAKRVLKRGGHFLCLEFSRVDVPGFDRIYDFYSFNLVPPMGRLVTGDAQPYQYLVESIRQFPEPDRFADMMRAAGFANVTHRPMTGGIVRLHSGWSI